MILVVIEWATDVINVYVIPTLVTVGLVAFLFGLLRYVSAGDDEEKIKQGRNFMLYGIIGLFVMVSVWGLVAVINRTLGIGQGGWATDIPSVSGTNDGNSTFNRNNMCPAVLSLPPKNFKELVCLGLVYINSLIVLVASLALMVFLYGLIKYVIVRGGDDKEREKARSYMIYGIIALFVMVSVWGLVAIFNRTLNFGQGGTLRKIEFKGE
jgi:hypothetical protein